MADLEQVMASQLDPSPTGSSDRPLGTTLDGMRGTNPAFGNLDAQNEVGPETNTQGSEAQEDSTVEEPVEAASEGSGEPEPVDELDVEVKKLQERLLASDRDRTRKSQEVSFLKGKLTELDSYTRLGIAIQENPKAYAAVQKVMAGGELTAADEKAVAGAATGQGMTPAKFMADVRKQVREEVQNSLSSHTYATREFAKLETRAKKELAHFDQLSEHPSFLGWVRATHQAIDEGSQLVPEGEDKNFFALKLAHDVMITSNPDYVEMVRKVGVKQGKESVAKKLAAAGPGTSSRGSTDSKAGKMTPDQNDRVNMLRAWHGNNTARRLPGARR